MPTAAEVTAFWAQVDQSGDCWVWLGRRDRDGYGWYAWNRRAHRFAWVITYGDPGDLHVLHRCDNPPCVRPDHLWVGTHAENMADRDAKRSLWRASPLDGIRRYARPVDEALLTLDDALNAADVDAALSAGRALLDEVLRMNYRLSRRVKT